MLNRLNFFTNNLLLQSRYRLLRHLLIFLVVLLISVNVLWDAPTEILTDRYGAWAIYFLLFIVIIYINMYGLVPELLLRGKTIRYILLATLLMLFFIASVGMLQSIAGDDSFSARTPPLIGILSGFATFYLFIVGLTAIQLFKYRVNNQQKISELENSTMAVELANLQNQINPHFLFNMINNANILAGEDVHKSSGMLSKLNDLLRYQVGKSSENSVSLHEDIVFLNDYLQLEKLRRDRFSYSIHSDGNTYIKVPPLLFIPFVENAVKHNPENDSFVTIVFHSKNNKLYFECKNTKAQLPITLKEGGIGLVNIKRRMDLLFERKYTLQLEDEKEFYKVIMEILI